MAVLDSQPLVTWTTTAAALYEILGNILHKSVCHLIRFMYVLIYLCNGPMHIMHYALVHLLRSIFATVESSVIQKVLINFLYSGSDK